MAKFNVLSRVLCPQIVHELNGLMREAEELPVLCFAMADYRGCLKDFVSMFDFFNSDVNRENVECRLTLFPCSLEDDLLLSRVLIKMRNGQLTEVPFRHELIFSHILQFNDFWNYVVDGKMTIIVECTILMKHIDQEMSLENLCLSHLMENLSKENVLEILKIADLYGFKSLTDQSIDLIQRHIDELQDTPIFASLKTELKDEIFNRPGLVLTTRDASMEHINFALVVRIVEFLERRASINNQKTE